MDVNLVHAPFKEIKAVILVFFCATLLQSCGKTERVHIDEIDYEGPKAVGVLFTTKMDVENLRIFIGDESQTSVIGVITSVKDKHRFAPVIPFTPGETYTFRKMDTVVMASFTIPERGVAPLNELLNLYPSKDTLPVNLLKMYVEFAQPMQEVGNALDHITMTDMTEGKQTQPFLRLESELWNQDRTVLTLWFDPGRIKTDLIPNRAYGLPLNEGHHYRMQIDSSWKTRQGIPLQQHYIKTFYVGPRDDRTPNVKDWQLHVQEEDASMKLFIDFGEPMDAFLATETMSIYDSKASQVKGDFMLKDNETVLIFTPTTNWEAGNYELRIQSRLEDLAGNNLNRLFDRKLRQTPKNDGQESHRSISFTVR